jgi:hypothetical protein
LSENQSKLSRSVEVKGELSRNIRDVKEIGMLYKMRGGALPIDTEALTLHADIVVSMSLGMSHSMSIYISATVNQTTMQTHPRLL